MTRKLSSRRFALAGLAAAAASIFALRLPAENRMPAKIVDEFHKTLIAVMRDADTLGFNGRYARLKPSIEDSFHLPIMTQIATGSFWRKASPAQQAQ